MEESNAREKAILLMEMLTVMGAGELFRFRFMEVYLDSVVQSWKIMRVEKKVPLDEALITLRKKEEKVKRAEHAMGLVAFPGKATTEFIATEIRGETDFLDCIEQSVEEGLVALHPYLPRGDGVLAPPCSLVYGALPDPKAHPRPNFYIGDMVSFVKGGKKKK